MPELSKTWLDDTTLRVMTYKSGSFTFQLGLDTPAIQPLLDRVNDAQKRFNKTPMLPQIIDQMQEKVLASSVYSTNTIEGGQFTEQETEDILKKDPATIQDAEQKRLTNLKEAIEWVNSKSTKKLQPHTGQAISLADVFTLHRLVSKQIDEEKNPAGRLRNNQPTQKTLVGDHNHGGNYQPPKCLDDIQYLLEAWIEWLNHPAILNQPVAIRAALAHYYFELIHPFWDGNGRTGRLIEMLILEQSGYRFSASAVWKYYQENIHAYFTLFNQCRKLAKKKLPGVSPNQGFVEFTVEGLRQTIEYLHDQTNVIIKILLFNTRLSELRYSKNISDRQFRLIRTYLEICGNVEPLSAANIFRKPAIQGLYKGISERTFYRDIEKLNSLGFLKDYEGKIIIMV